MLEITLLDKAKAVTGSDYATAKRLNTSKQRISNIRNGLHGMDEYIAGEIAELIGEDPVQTICKLREEKASTFKEKQAWKRWAGAAVFTFVTGLICATHPESVTYAFFAPLFSIHYAYMNVSRSGSRSSYAGATFTARDRNDCPRTYKESGTIVQSDRFFPRR